MPPQTTAPLGSANVTVGERLPTPLIDVVIVGYHSRELVLQCLQTLPAAADGLPVSVCVVDNGSNDGTVAAVGSWARAHPDIPTHVLDLGANTGFAHASNVGMAHGRAPYLLTLNPDTAAEPMALRRLVEFAETQPSLGVVAPALRNADGSPQLTGRAFPTAAAGLFGRRSPLTRWFPRNPWSARFLVERRHLGSDEPYRVDWVSGAAMLVPRAVVEQVGGFDEGFFLFWEDADWCRRIDAAGYAVWCLPSAQIVHDEGGTRGHVHTPMTTRSFHAGAYRYWTKHHAPQPWNPLRWLAGAALAGRAGVLILEYRRRTWPSRSRRVTRTASKGSPS